MAVNTRGFRTGRLRLVAPRPAQSRALDEFQPTTKGGTLDSVPYMDWDRFVEAFDFRQGEHITLVGGTGSGKTTLARELILPRRDFVSVFGTKKKDASLYGPLTAAGYVLTDDWDPYDEEIPKVIFRPTISGVGKGGKAGQSNAFEEAMDEVFEAGNWCCYFDEVAYLSKNLKLATPLETLWMQGRSLGISMVAATQRPVEIPLIAYEANHLFLWKFTDKRNVDTISEFTGSNINVARQVIPRLPRYEALYINTVTDEICRTKARI